LNLDHISTLHEYNRLARQGFVPELAHSCGEPYAVISALTEDRFVLKCYGCGAVVDPGLADLKGWQARIDDYKAKRA
jgi:hypothetical protein